MFKIPTGEDGLWPFIAEEMGRTDFCSAQGTLGSVVLQQETTIPNAKRMGYIAVFYWGWGCLVRVGSSRSVEEGVLWPCSMGRVLT